MAPTDTVVIGLCTRGRPAMLARCLATLEKQQIPADLRVELVVVDNEERPNNCNAVLALAQRCPFPVHYVHQPRQGIAIARNTVVEKAAELDAGWVAFLDDDEIAAPDWIVMLMASEYRQVPVLVGKQELIYPDPLPFWARRMEPAPLSEGQRRTSAATCNVRFSADLIRAGLRFNESLGFANGSDTDFFLRAHQSGFEIRQTLRAVTYEDVHPERLTYRAQVYRAYCHAISLNRRLAIKSGRRKALTRAAVIVPRDLVLGSLQILISPAYAITGARNFSACAVLGGQKLGRAAGSLAGLLGILPQPYRRVVGR